MWLWFTLLPTLRTGLVRAIVYLAALFVIILPWTARNYFIGNGLELISSQGGRDFWIYNLRALEPGATESSLRDLRHANSTDADFDANMRQVVLERILANPAAWVVAKSSEVSEIWSNNESNLTGTESFSD